MKGFLKKYFKKRKEDLQVGNVKSWATLLKVRKSNLSKLVKKDSGERSKRDVDRVETFILQTNAIKMSFFELVDRWDLKATEDELENLKNIEINSVDDVDTLILYLEYLHRELEERHNVFLLNSRFLFLPITIGEVMTVLLAFVVFTLI